MERTLPFGKHKDQPLSTVPTGYLRWAIEQDVIRSAELKVAVKAEIARRQDEGTDEQEGAGAVEQAAQAFDGEVVETTPRAGGRKALSIHGWPGARPDVTPEPAATCESCGRPGTPGDPLVHRSCSSVPF